MKYEYYLVYAYELEFWTKHFDEFCAKYHEDEVLLRILTLEEIYDDARDISRYSVVRVLSSKIRDCLTFRYYPFSREELIG